MRRALCVILVLGFAPFARAADSEPSPLESAVQRLVRAADGKEAATAVKEILGLAPDPADLLALLRKPDRGDGSRPPPEKPGWQIRKHVWPDGVERAYHLYVPPRAKGAPPSPLLFHLHGGVARPKPIPTNDPGFVQYREWWTEEARKHSMFVVFPLGEAKACWWTENAAGALRGIQRDLERQYPIDVNRVFVTGFSDGGSGCFYLAMTHPTPYAGFIPLNGHPAVASSASGRQLYPINTSMRPLYVVNTQADPLYPTVSVLPFLAAMMRAGAEMRFTSYPGIGHTPAYRAEQDPLIGAWIEETERDPLPAEVTFETADLDCARAAWVTLLELGKTEHDAALPDVNVMMPKGRVLLGVTVDRAFDGEGVRIGKVQADSLAQALGLQPGDVITGVEGREIHGLGDLREILGKKDWGETVTIRWRRGEKVHRAQGTFPTYTPRPAFTRERPSGRIEVQAEGNRIEVRTRGVVRYALDISPDLFDLGKQITVTTNGEVSYQGRVKTDLGHLLRSFARDRDPAMLFAARIEIHLER